MRIWNEDMMKEGHEWNGCCTVAPSSSWQLLVLLRRREASGGWTRWRYRGQWIFSSSSLGIVYISVLQEPAIDPSGVLRYVAIRWFLLQLMCKHIYKPLHSSTRLLNLRNSFSYLLVTVRKVFRSEKESWSRTSRAGKARGLLDATTHR